MSASSETPAKVKAKVGTPTWPRDKRYAVGICTEYVVLLYGRFYGDCTCVGRNLLNGFSDFFFVVCRHCRRVH